MLEPNCGESSPVVFLGLLLILLRGDTNGGNDNIDGSVICF